MHDMNDRLIDAWQQAPYNMIDKGNGWLREGECPECSKKQLYTHMSSPWFATCGRPEKCGYKDTARELLPHLYENFNETYVPSTEEPNRTANAYMSLVRGFDISKITGWFEQSKFWTSRVNRGTATVRFYLDDTRTIYMERFVETLIETKEDGSKAPRKQHFHGSHKGLWWQPPGFEIKAGDEIWLTEACIDAISLNVNGIKAVANLSSVNYPATMLEQYKDLDVTWVWALDNDKAGKSKTKQHVKTQRDAGFTNVTAAQVPGKIKRDWNDLHVRGQFADKNLKTYRYHGKLLLAESPSEKALLMFNHQARNSFYFHHNRRLYWWELNIDRFTKEMDRDQSEFDTKEEFLKFREEKLQSSGMLTQIANCQLSFLYFQMNCVTDESWYYVEVTTPNGNKKKNTLNGGQITSPGDFKKRLVSIISGAMFTGKAYHLERFVGDQIEGLKEVQTIDHIGYSKIHNAYIYSDIAIAGGKLYKMNEEDYFDIGKISVKSLGKSVRLNINTSEEKYRADWPMMIYDFLGTNGVIVLAYWFASFFAEQIRELHGSFPFLEMYGEPGTGKSTIIEFLWKCSGRASYEGFDPSSASAPALNRNLSQVSNLPIILMEGDREDESKYKSFDYNRLKPLYNGRSIASRGVKNHGNETYEPPFMGALIIEQNAPVDASKAILERLIQICFSKEGQSEKTKDLADQMRQIPMEELSGFIVRATMAEQQVMSVIKANMPGYMKHLMKHPEIASIRIAETHGQIMAIIDALGHVVNLPADVLQQAKDTIGELAIKRQVAINDDHALVKEFWEAYEHLNPGEHNDRLNHHRDENLIAINLKHMESLAGDCKVSLPYRKELIKHLKNSKSRKFVKQDSVNSKINNRSVRCWLFKKEA